MSRPLRIEFAGALYFLTSRGNEGQNIFLNDEDYATFLDVLEHVCERFHWRVFAYSLMPKHFQIVVETPEANLSAGMRQLNGVYTQRFHQRHQCDGRLFHGRFKGVLVEKEVYLTSLCRDVIQAPVREQLANSVADWRWSSYHLTCARHDSGGWFAVDELLAHYGKQRNVAVRKFQEWLLDVPAKPVTRQIRHQIFLGSEVFVSQMSALAALGTDSLVKKSVPAIDDFKEQFGEDRNAAIRAAFATGGYTLAKLGEHFDLHYASISRIVASPRR